MTQEDKINKLESTVGELKHEWTDFKSNMQGTFDKVADSMHDLAMAINESKFRDENLKSYVEQNNKYLQEKQIELKDSINSINKKIDEFMTKTNEKITTIDKQQSQNSKTIGNASSVWYGAIKNIVAGIVGALLLWVGLK